MGREWVLLVFCPGDVLEDPPRSNDALSLLPWFKFLDGVRVWLVTDDAGSSAASRSTDPFPELPVLVDSDGAVAERYQVSWPDGTSARSTVTVVLTDASRTVRYERDSPGAAGVRELRDTIGSRGGEPA